jgi:predicted deacetylase
MDYAFRVFAAIYGHRVIEGDSSEKALTVVYGDLPGRISEQERFLQIPARYQPSVANQGIPELTRHSYAGEDFFLFHGLDQQWGRPDWLGEIFEWLSSGHEKAIQLRDSVGRIPDSEMIFARQKIPAWKPHASCLMAWLENCLNGRESEPALPKAPSPVPGVEHLVICSHDIDFYYTNRASAFHRLMKNLAIAVLQYKSWDYFSANCTMMIGLLKGDRIGDYIPKMISRLTENKATSTLFVVPQRAHRRDPNYSLEDFAGILKDASEQGFPIEIHGSYTSSIEARTLLPEATKLRNIIKRSPTGNRQHWLRFDKTEDVFRCVEEAKLRFDSSVGFTDQVGFRNGASFAFPPYNFQAERAYDFLEIPLAIMDGSLVEESRDSGETPQFLAERVLAESRKWGWGGISVLWHNPIEALAVPEEINRVFWDCTANKESFREKWISTHDFFSLSLRRYQAAGLLREVLNPELAGDEAAGARVTSSDAHSNPVAPRKNAAMPIVSPISDC